MHPFEQTAEPELLQKQIKELGLRLEGSAVEKYVHQLQRELERKGLKHFKPACYLTDEWGCPDRVPIIGIPFDLADNRLTRIEREMGYTSYDKKDLMILLRHETGHAVNYAYELYKTAEWEEIFGFFERTYPANFKFKLESTSR